MTALGFEPYVDEMGNTVSPLEGSLIWETFYHDLSDATLDAICAADKKHVCTRMKLSASRSYERIYKRKLKRRC